MRGPPIRWHINWVRLDLIWNPNNGDSSPNTKPLSSEHSLSPISLAVNLLPATSAARYGVLGITKATGSFNVCVCVSAQVSSHLMLSACVFYRLIPVTQCGHILVNINTLLVSPSFYWLYDSVLVLQFKEHHTIESKSRKNSHKLNKWFIVQKKDDSK